MGAITTETEKLFATGNNLEEKRAHQAVYLDQHPKQNMKVYLAIPYTFNPAKSFDIANKVSADLMSKGFTVFSPISHSHPIADHLPDELRTNSDWWMGQDLPLVDWADEVHVVCIGEYGDELIEKSKGIQMEIAHAKQSKKPIKIIHYNDQARIL